MANIDLVFDPPTNGTDFMGIMNYFNSLTDVGNGGMFWTVMLIVFATILFLMMKAYSTEKAMSWTLVISAVIAGLLRILNWINDATVAIFIIFGAVSLAYLLREASNYE